jgi:aromatic-L-amino-acid decarboxylase
VATVSEPSAPDGPLRLDASREELLDRAAAIVTDAWRSFDRFRPGQPPVDDLVRRLVELRLPEHPTPASEVLDDAAMVLDRSLAQPRPRFFAFVGSSGLEIGVLGDLLASCFDVNLAA